MVMQTTFNNHIINQTMDYHAHTNDNVLINPNASKSASDKNIYNTRMHEKTYILHISFNKKKVALESNSAIMLITVNYTAYAHMHSVDYSEALSCKQ